MGRILDDTIEYYKNMAAKESNPRLKEHYLKQAGKLESLKAERLKNVS